ncbi:MAG: diaminopimelate decarboxylase, partial [Bacteroidales bacterium]|nr:diaminopimelate decarboxylase [Bacteroidales bacterium]
MDFNNLETPYYYYDLALLRRTLDEVKRCTKNYPEFHVHYAVKANFNPRILQTIAAAGLGADCVSGGEVSAAAAAGIPSEKIVFAGVGKSDSEIVTALRTGIACFNVESRPE